MSIEMISLSKLTPSKNNPRKSFDTHTIESLAASIKTDGLLQNLVVKPKGKKGQYDIISGERRFRALSLLVENGDLPKEITIPCEVRQNIDQDTANRIAIIENIQRENLPPLEEAEAVVALLQDGEKLDDICAQTGLSETTIKRRLALVSLSDDVKAALGEGYITLSQAEALTLGSHEKQRNWLKRRCLDDAAKDIRDFMIMENPPVSLAMFDIQNYTGTFTHDLFATEETTYFDDAEQFHNLQHEAVESLCHDLALEGYEPVTIEEGFCFNNWQYRDAEEDETGGAVIHLHPSGEVKTYVNIIHRDLDKKAIESLDKKPRPTYSKPLCEYIAMHKTLAVQAALLDNPRTAKELAIVQMISGHNGVSVKPHQALSYFAESEECPAALEKLHHSLALLWSLAGKTVTDITHSYQLSTTKDESTDIYVQLKSLSDAELDELHLLLSILGYGQLFCNQLDTNKESLFNRVANDLNIDMRDYWIADKAFLSRRSLSQIKDILIESGLRAIIGNGEGIKKSKLVEALSKHFKRIAETDHPSKHEQMVRQWLPAVFQFPAVDSDAVIETDDHTIDDDSHFAEAA